MEVKAQFSQHLNVETGLLIGAPSVGRMDKVAKLVQTPCTDLLLALRPQALSRTVGYSDHNPAPSQPLLSLHPHSFIHLFN